jgi:allantoate deiminase
VSIANRRGLTVVASSMLMDQPAVIMDAQLCTLASDAIRGLGMTPLSMVSGAGHDAMIMAERVPGNDDLSAQSRRHQPSSRGVGPSQDVENALAAGLALLRHTLEGTEHSPCITWDIPAAIASPPICCRRRIRL